MDDLMAHARALGLSKAELPQLTALDALGPPSQPAALPDAPALAELLAQLLVAPEDAAAITAARPSPEASPHHWWLIERCVSDLARGLGIVQERPPWPTLPADGSALNRLLYVYVFLAATPQIRAWHAARGIPDAISWATLGDLGGQIEGYRLAHGVSGFDEHFWLTHHYTGVIYRLGRLQFERTQLIFDPGGALPPLVRKGEPALAVHIPSDGPLAPAACDESFAQARPFYRRYFPEHDYRVAGCGSWLLDPQLAEYLPAESNIVQFQRRFALGDEPRWDADEELSMMLFNLPQPASLDDLPQQTALQRAFVQHLRAGRHWTGRVGWLLLED